MLVMGLAERLLWGISKKLSSRLVMIEPTSPTFL
jgi:hypothetical protein